MLALSSWRSRLEQDSPSKSFPSSSSSPCAAQQQVLLNNVNVGTLSRMLQRGQQLPEPYRWSRIDDDDADDCGGTEEEEEEDLPVIDLKELLDKSDERYGAFVNEKEFNAVSQQIKAACVEWGAFQLVNHGVPDRIVDTVRDKGLELFALPEADKLRAERVSGTLFGYGATRMASFFNRLMWSEAFTMMGTPNSNIADYANKLGMNEDDEFCQSFEAYDRAMRKLALLIIKLIFNGLQATSEQVANTSDFWGMIHMNYYPPCPTPSQAMGLAAHTDSSCLTIMHQGNVGGLQVKKGNRWIAAKPLPNAFVIQVGDMLQVMSNNMFKSVVHRALVNDRFTRLSLVYFFTPSPSATISPIHTNESLYRTLTWSEYLQVKARHFMGALDHFLLPLHR